MTKAAAQPDSDRDVLVRLRNVSKRFDRVTAVEPLDLAIRRGDFFAILGPSGCGKTTLLRIIGGFIRPTSGRVEIAGADVTDKGPERRPTNMVFQGYGLFPHMSVRQNIAYGLRVVRKPAREVRVRVERVIELVHLSELADRSPHELSGGQQQRVALARALVMEPAVLLLDEPLAALDLQLRKAMQDELRRLHQSIGGTFIFVTHDQGEALGLANRLAVMQEGRIVQEGTPEEIYARPATEFVARFIGEANLLPGERRGGRVALEAGTTFADLGREGAVVVIVRPEALALASDSAAFEIELEGRLVDAVYLGSHVSYKVTLASGQEIVVHQGAAAAHRPRVGEPVRVGWGAATHRVLDVG